MTREEAIAILEDEAYVLYEDDSPYNRQAFDMAIEALEFLDRYDEFWKEVKFAGNQGREIEIHHGGKAFRIREVAQ